MPEGNYTGMNATWVCYQSGESFDKNVAYNLTEYDGIDLGLGGCFGHGIGKLNYDMPLAYLDNRMMTSGSSYTVWLSIEKEGVKTESQQDITTIVSPPKFAIR